MLFTHTSVTGQQKMNSLTETKCKVIVSQESLVLLQVAHTENDENRLHVHATGHTIKSLKVWAYAVLERHPLNLGPMAIANQLHRQLTTLAGHLHCNEARKKVQMHMQTDRKM